MRPIGLDVVGIGAWSAAHRGWPALAAAFAGRATDAPPAERPSPSLLPPAERRRAPDGVAVALEVAVEAAAASGIDRGALASVFASAHGDLAIVDYLCATLATDPALLSPTKFHLSVHNAASGYWSIAAADRAPSTAIAGGDDSFALGLVEAATIATAEARPVLLVAFDTRATGLLASAVDNDALFGFALVVAPSTDPAVSLTIDAGACAMPLPTTLHELARSSPAARALALAEALARDDVTTVRYPLGPGSVLSVTVRGRAAAAADAAPMAIE